MRWLLLLLTFTSLHAEKYTLSACAIFRDEARFLKEWVEFHQLVGVEHFYLLNNLSSDNYEEVLKPYVDAGTVTLIEWDHSFELLREWNHIQMSAYNHVIETYGQETKWLAVIDTDEFLYPVRKSDLKEVLKGFEAFAAVCVNWQMFGTSGVEEIPPGKLLIETLTRKARRLHDENRHIKSIVRPKFVTGGSNPHFFHYLQGWYQVSEKKKRFEKGVAPSIRVQKLCINHYWTRDESFYRDVKIPRRLAFRDSVEGCEERKANLNRVSDDTRISHFIPSLRKQMEKSP